jgi:hypothetical protein
VLLLGTCLFAIAWRARSRALRFAWLFVLVSPLPIAFVLPRGAAQYYIPLFGWALYGAALVIGAGDVLFRRWPALNTLPALRLRNAALVLAVALALIPFHQTAGFDGPVSVTVAGEENRSMVQQLHRLQPRLFPGARLLFLNDPIPADWENMSFMVRLSYRDNSLIVNRAKRMTQELTSEQLASYNHVFDYRGGHFIELTSPWMRRPVPAVTIENGRLQVFHQDWSPVTVDRPAKPGEELITKAIDLGETNPGVPPGQPFPRDPLADVVSPIQALVNNEEAQISVKIGWPAEVDLYRVDFRIPERTHAGMATLRLLANGITGVPVEIPVK